MPSIYAYLGEPGSGKSYLMRSHVREMIKNADHPAFLICDHDNSWDFGEVYHSIAEYLDNPHPVAVFRGCPAEAIAMAAIKIGDSCYVDDEIDGAIDDGWKHNAIREITKRGRHLRNVAGRICAVDAMIATHRPVNLPTDVTGLFERVYFGRFKGLRDARRIFEESWLPEARSPEDAQRILMSLQTGEFRTWPA